MKTSQSLGSWPVANRVFHDMTNLLNNPAHWRQRAQETRLIAESARDPEAKRLQLNLVESYEQLATRAEDRALGKRK